MEPGTTVESFLEPIYLNEKMVLNCAAYLFKGYSLESETQDKDQSERSKSFKAGLGFLDKLLSFGGEVQSKQSQATETRSARRYTVGGLHMSLLDELHVRDMLRVIDPKNLIDDTAESHSYFEMLATLRPIAFYDLVNTLRIGSPIVGEVLKSVVAPMYAARKRQKEALRIESQQAILPSASAGAGKQQQPVAKKPQQQAPKEAPKDQFQLALDNVDEYLTAFKFVLQQLEDDYRRSKQLEMVMWSIGDDPRPYGVVDLDLGDYEPEELRAKLSAGTFHVVGKVTRVVDAHESINLVQRSVLWSALDVFNHLVEIQGPTDGLTQYRRRMREAKSWIERFGLLLEIQGPAVRLSAMSVCI